MKKKKRIEKEEKRLLKRQHKLCKKMRRLLHKANKKANKFLVKPEKGHLKLQKAIQKAKYKELKKSRKLLKKANKGAKKYFKNGKRVIARAKHRAMNEPPHLTVLEEIGNSVTHGLGACFAIVALVLMLMKSHTTLSILASCFYGLSLFFMMLMSCLYHAFKGGSTVKRIWRRFDYSSIYLLIGGTFAPLFLVYWGNTIGIVLFCIQWGLIITGITMVAIFGPGRLRWLHFPLYFVIGWSGLMFIPGWIKHDPMLLWWILSGGIVYTLGMIPFVKRGVKASHFIWHFFVLAGAIVHFIGIYLYVF